MSERRRVAILGATGHVGKVLAAGLDGEYELTLYARRPAVAAAFASAAGLSAVAAPIEALGGSRHDALISCIGVADPRAVAANPARVYETACAADELAMGYLAENPGCRLVNFSSGAAYCSDFEEPADDTTASDLSANALRPDQHYGLAKLASEGRHRTRTELAIVDLRLFSFFSRHIDPAAAFLMNDVLRSVKEKTTLLTGASDHMRDYVAPGDLSALVSLCIEREPFNDAIDVYSAAPVGKFELLDAFRDRFGLAYTVSDVPAPASATGSKAAYFSRVRKAQALGYVPTMTSLETLVEESEAVLTTMR